MKDSFISQEAPKVKTLRRISAATILSLMLAVSVFAGHIETPGVACPTSTVTATVDVASSTLLAVVAVIY